MDFVTGGQKLLREIRAAGGAPGGKLIKIAWRPPIDRVIARSIFAYGGKWIVILKPQRFSCSPEKELLSKLEKRTSYGPANEAKNTKIIENQWKSMTINENQ